MNNVNFLKPNKENLNLYLVLGALFFTLGIVDFCLNNFYAIQHCLSELSGKYRDFWVNKNLKVKIMPEEVDLKLNRCID